MYENINDIPQFPHANYQVNVGWQHIDMFLNCGFLVDTDPAYQRGYVWTQYQKERYIEYRLRGGKSGRDILWNCPNWQVNKGNTDWYNTLELVDGKQRLNAVQEFMTGQVRAFGKTLQEYADGSSFRIGRHDFIFFVNNLHTPREVVDWYLGLNAGGSIHTEFDLQTARNVLKLLEP